MFRRLSVIASSDGLGVRYRSLSLGIIYVSRTIVVVDLGRITDLTYSLSAAIDYTFVLPTKPLSESHFSHSTCLKPSKTVQICLLSWKDLSHPIVLLGNYKSSCAVTRTFKNKRL